MFLGGCGNSSMLRRGMIKLPSLDVLGMYLEGGWSCGLKPSSILLSL